MARFRQHRNHQDKLADHCELRKNLWFEFDAFSVPEWPGCYVIYIDGEMVYVGQTENAKMRFRTHRTKGVLKGVLENRIRIKIKLGRRFGEWAMTEIRLIKRLLPKLNRARIGNKSEVWI